MGSKPLSRHKPSVCAGFSIQLKCRSRRFYYRQACQNALIRMMRPVFVTAGLTSDWPYLFLYILVFPRRIGNREEALAVGLSGAYPENGWGMNIQGHRGRH